MDLENNVKKTNFKIKYHHRYELREWLSENFPFLRTKSEFDYGEEEAKQVEGRTVEIVDACRQVEEIDLRSRSEYVDYYKQDWRAIRKFYAEKDYVKMARALNVLLDAIDVE